MFFHILSLIPFGIVYSSFFEWILHKYLMHRPVPGLRYPFQAHAVVHHGMFKADSTYHLHDPESAHKIHMAWWNAPVLVVVASSPFWLGFIWGYWLLLAVTAVCLALYYGAYEYLHWCMHNPEAEKKVLNTPLRRFYMFINGHHLLHHRFMHKNFNVVLPFADLVLGTLLLRSPVSFAQPEGPGIPDVQPKVSSKTEDSSETKS